MNSRLKLILFLIFILIIAFSCKKAKKEQSQMEDMHRYGGVLRLMQDIPYSLDPLYMRNVYESTLLNQIFNGLLDLDDNLNIVPGIAKYWEISKDRKTYKFFLNDNVFFHNGRKLNAYDFVFTFKRILNFSKSEPFLGVEYLKLIVGAKDFLENKTQNIQGLKVVDSLTLEITLNEPCSPFLTVLSMSNFSVVPEEEVLNNTNFGSAPVGTGPFKFKSWSEDRIILVNNEKYFEGRPYLDSIIFYVPMHFTYDDEINKFINNELDVTTVSMQRLDELKESNKYRILSRPELSIYFLGFNNKIPPYDDKKFRSAIFYAIDNENFSVNYGTSRLTAKGFVPPGLLSYDPSQKHKSYDIELAKKLLNQYRINSKNQVSKLKLYTIKGNKETEIVENLNDLGLDVEVIGLTWIDFSKKLDKGELSMFTLGWVADFPDPDAFFYDIIHSKGGSNFFRFYDRQVDSLLDLGKKESDLNQRIKIYQKIEDILKDQAVFVPLYYGLNTVATQKYVNDFNISPIGFMNLNLKKVWIEK